MKCGRGPSRGYTCTTSRWRNSHGFRKRLHLCRHIFVQGLEKAGADADAEKKVKASGQLKKEGKNYVVQSGDVMHFKFNN